MSVGSLERIAAAAAAVCAAAEELNDAVDAAQDAGDSPGSIRMAMRSGRLPQLRPDLISPAIGLPSMSPRRLPAAPNR